MAVTLAVTGVRRDAESAALARFEETPLLLPPCCRGAVSSVTAVAAIELSRQQLEGDLMPRADDAEVAPVKRRDFGDVKSLRRSDH